jgi:hypothetical protein
MRDAIIASPTTLATAPPIHRRSRFIVPRSKSPDGFPSAADGPPILAPHTPPPAPKPNRASTGTAS